MVASASYLSRIHRPNIGGSIPPQTLAERRTESKVLRKENKLLFRVLRNALIVSIEFKEVIHT